MIEELTKDIEFHNQSIVLFGKLKAQYMFTHISTLRKQLKEIIVFHQQETQGAEKEIKLRKRIIKKIDTPTLTPDDPNHKED